MVGEARFPPIAARAPRFAGREPASCAACVRRGSGERPATARAFGDLSRSAARARDALHLQRPPPRWAAWSPCGGVAPVLRERTAGAFEPRWTCESPLPVMSSTKRRRIVRRPAAGSLMPDSWERGRPARRRARGPPHGKAGGTPALPGSPSVWFRLRRIRVSCPMLDCHGKVSSIDRRGKESEPPDGEGSRVDAKAEIGWNPPRSRRSGAPAIEASRQCGPRAWFPPRDARTGHAGRSEAGTPAALTNRLQLEERSP